jgi:hypothetical protein
MSSFMRPKQTLKDRHRIAEEILGVPVEWESDVRGCLECPMRHAHTTPTKRGHTIVYLDGVPTIFCWHQSCRDWVKLANTELREKLDERSSEDKARDAEARTAKQAALQASDNLRRSLPEIIKAWQWDSILNDRPKLTPSESFQKFLTLWNDSDVIWIGDVWDTGVNEKKDKSYHFATVGTWKTRKLNMYANHYTTGSSFKPGSVDRITSNIGGAPYTIVEFDSLSPDPEINKRRGAALINYLYKVGGLDLVMVVDSGNKSIHGWFRNSLTAEDKFFLRQIGADPQSMRPSQPVRLPGAIRNDGGIQHLLWIA